MNAHTTVGDDEWILYKAFEWGKYQHSYVMHNPKQERCMVLPWKGVRGKGSAAGEGKRSTVNFDCAVHQDSPFRPYQKVKGEERKWKSGPETGIFNNLVYFIEVRL